MMLLVLLGGARALCAPPPASQRSVIITNHPSGVLELSLDRAPKLNALNGQMIETMSAEVARAKSDASVSGVLLTSTASRAFCAGGDIAGVAAMADTVRLLPPHAIPSVTPLSDDARAFHHRTRARSFVASTC